MDRIDTMHVFLRVAETGSFTQAANQLNLPRATVSSAVQRLESTLGTRLLHRTTRIVQLTRDGSALVERCRGFLAELDDIENLFRDVPARVRGRLKIDVPTRVARIIIVPALPDFLARHPEIELELGATDRPVDILQEGVDCVIRVGNLYSSGMTSHLIGHFPLLSCASPSYLQRYGVPLAPTDLNDHWVVNYASSGSGTILPWKYSDNGEYRSRTLRSRITVNNAETYVACGLAGLGLIQAPAYGLLDHIARGELVEVMPQARAEPMPVYAIHPNRHQLSHRVQAFIEWMKERLSFPLADEIR
ncbi:MAG: LysR family transcriptional regulator [Gammaproteobacteria bacterium]|nr:LysR family transcriptional regulator [Gammaproteobacteria bacterium]